MTISKKGFIYNVAFLFSDEKRNQVSICTLVGKSLQSLILLSLVMILLLVVPLFVIYTLAMPLLILIEENSGNEFFVAIIAATLILELFLFVGSAIRRSTFGVMCKGWLEANKEKMCPLVHCID